MSLYGGSEDNNVRNTRNIETEFKYVHTTYVRTICIRTYVLHLPTYYLRTYYLPAEINKISLVFNFGVCYYVVAKKLGIVPLDAVPTFFLTKLLSNVGDGGAMSNTMTFLGLDSH